MYIQLHVKYRLSLSDFNESLTCVSDLWKIPKYQISWKCMHASSGRRVPCGRSGMTKLRVAFRDFASASEKERASRLCVYRLLWKSEQLHIMCMCYENRARTELLRTDGRWRIQFLFHVFFNLSENGVNRVFCAWKLSHTDQNILQAKFDTASRGRRCIFVVKMA
jgi:hypothetical protein